MPAVFADIQPVRIIFLVLHCGVVAPLAVTTRQREDDAVVFLSHGLKLLLGRVAGRADENTLETESWRAL